MTVAVPTRIGRYSVESLLGAGAMGCVYLGRDPDLDRQVAIKTIRQTDLDSAAQRMFLDRFRNEARAAAKLHHPCIVQVYDVGEDPTHGPFLVFEYIAGATLKHVLRDQGPLPVARLEQLATDVASALDLAHAAGIIHRDVKPENLLVTAAGTTKLADFGIARVPNAALTQDGQFLGTPCYAAPETLKSSAYSPASDIYSFAAVLYEAVTGARAFPGTDAMSVAHRVVHDPPRPPSEVAADSPTLTKSVEKVILRGLAKAPEKRFGSAGELSDALHAALRGERMSRRPIKRTRAEGAPPSIGARVAFGMAVVGAAAIGFALWSSRGPSVEDPPVEPGVRATRGIKIAPPETMPSVEALPEGTEAPTPQEEPSPSGAHDREERAKDAIARARDAIGRSDWPTARAAIDEARRNDPGNADIDTLAARIPTASNP